MVPELYVSQTPRLWRDKSDDHPYAKRVGQDPRHPPPPSMIEPDSMTASGGVSQLAEKGLLWNSPQKIFEGARYSRRARYFLRNLLD